MVIMAGGIARRRVRTMATVTKDDGFYDNCGNPPVLIG